MKLLLLLVLVLGCKSRTSNQAAEALAKVQGFADDMCKCDDKACAHEVNEAYTKWGTEMAKDASPATAKPDPELAKQFTEAAAKYADCFTKIATTPTIAEPAPEPPRDPVDAMVVAPTPTGDVLVEHVIDEARKWVKRDWPDLAIIGLTAKYIRASGVVDPKYGTLEIELGIPDRPVIDDDPGRPTGAPIEPPDEPASDRVECPFLVWKDNDWAEDSKPCRKTRPIIGPKCQASAIWNRAIDQKAPANAVAVLAMTGDSWAFSIKDPVRKVDFVRRYADDCKPILEQK